MAKKKKKKENKSLTHFNNQTRTGLMRQITFADLEMGIKKFRQMGEISFLNLYGSLQRSKPAFESGLITASSSAPQPGLQKPPNVIASAIRGPFVIDFEDEYLPAYPIIKGAYVESGKINYLPVQMNLGWAKDLLDELGVEYLPISEITEEIFDDRHKERIDSKFCLLNNQDHWAVILYSRGGSKSKNPRNSGYQEGLKLLLGRLKELEGEITEVLLDSETVFKVNMALEDRRLLTNCPVNLKTEKDLSVLANEIMKNSAAHGREADSGGNRTKQIRLEFVLPREFTREELIATISKGHRQSMLSEIKLSRNPQAFILTWNPKKSDSLTEDMTISWAQETKSGSVIRDQRWSTGGRKSGIQKGDTVYLLRQGDDRRGLIAKGVATSDIFQADHWDGSGREANYVRFDVLQSLTVNDRISTNHLKELKTNTEWDRLQSSGVAIPNSDLNLIDRAWSDWLERTATISGENLSVNEGALDLDRENLPEGARERVTVNRYERNSKNRATCLKHFGYKCWVCEMKFEDHYGEWGKDFIEVHHIIPVSQIGPNYRINPQEDLVPLCSNCHRMVHRKRDKVLTPNQLREIMGLAPK